MLAQDPGFATRLVRKGIVAQTAVRIAAGAGVVAASLLIVGPNPAEAGADRHGSGHSNNDYRKNDSGGPGGYSNRGASNFVKDVVNGFGTVAAFNKPSRPNLDPPKMEIGSSGGDSGGLFAVQSVEPEGQLAMRSAAVAEAPAGDNVMAAATPGGGSDYAGQPAAAVRTPGVTVGNGRTPGTNVAQPPAAPEAVYTQDSLAAPGAVPTAIEINVPPLPPPLPPVQKIRPAELVVGQFGTGTTDTVTDPLAGVAGLVLIPAIGAVLGYRQARAAQSLRASLRT